MSLTSIAFALTIVSNSSSAFGVLFCLPGRPMGCSSSPSVEYNVALLLAVKRLVQGHTRVSWACQGHAINTWACQLYTTLHHPYASPTPPTLPFPRQQESYFKKNFMYLLGCKLPSKYIFQMKWLGLLHFLKYTFYYFLVFAMKVSFKL